MAVLSCCLTLSGVGRRAASGMARVARPHGAALAEMWCVLCAVSGCRCLAKLRARELRQSAGRPHSAHELPMLIYLAKVCHLLLSDVETRVCYLDLMGGWAELGERINVDGAFACVQIRHSYLSLTKTVERKITIVMPQWFVVPWVQRRLFTAYVAKYTFLHFSSTPGHLIRLISFNFGTFHWL